MSKAKDVQDQIDAIIVQQISLLRLRAKECARQFNQKRYQDITEEYWVLENKLKTLIAPTTDSSSERVVTKSEALGSPYDLEQPFLKIEDPYIRFKEEMSQPDLHSQVSRLPETINIGAANDGRTRAQLNWTRVRQHNS